MTDIELAAMPIIYNYPMPRLLIKRALQMPIKVPQLYCESLCWIAAYPTLCLKKAFGLREFFFFFLIDLFSLKIN